MSSRPDPPGPPLKCLFVINDLARAGAEKQVSLLACGLVARGWSVSVALVKHRNDFAEPLAAAAIPVSALRRTGPFDLGVLMRLRRLVKERSPDVVVSFLFLANLLTVLASRPIKRRPPLVVSVRASYVSTLTFVQRLVARIAHRSADLVWFNSMRVLREEENGFPRLSRSVYLPNAVTPRRVEPIDWPTEGVGRVILSVGQLTPIKGHRVLIEAFAALSRAHPTTRLVLLGDGPEAPSLRSLVESKGMADRVMFLGHREDPLPFMTAADLFVQPSHSEGMSNSLLEAMSVGCPIVATSVGAAPDLLEDGVHALLCHPAAPNLATAMDRVLADPALGDRLGRAARRRAEDFSVDRIASDLDGTLRRVVQQHQDRLAIKAPPPLP